MLGEQVCLLSRASRPDSSLHTIQARDHQLHTLAAARTRENVFALSMCLENIVLPFSRTHSYLEMPRMQLNIIIHQLRKLKQQGKVTSNLNAFGRSSDKAACQCPRP